MAASTFYLYVSYLISICLFFISEEPSFGDFRQSPAVVQQRRILDISRLLIASLFFRSRQKKIQMKNNTINHGRVKRFKKKKKTGLSIATSAKNTIRINLDQFSVFFGPVLVFSCSPVRGGNSSVSSVPCLAESLRVTRK